MKTPEGVKSITHGALIVATGGTEHKPNEYLYGKDPRVVTQRELERQIADGKLESARRTPTVAMIQCVGSRNEERPFCSRSCCTDAVKNAIRIKELQAGRERGRALPRHADLRLERALLSEGARDGRAVREIRAGERRRR